MTTLTIWSKKKHRILTSCLLIWPLTSQMHLTSLETKQDRLSFSKCKSYIDWETKFDAICFCPQILAINYNKYSLEFKISISFSAAHFRHSDASSPCKSTNEQKNRFQQVLTAYIATSLMLWAERQKRKLASVLSGQRERKLTAHCY